MTKQEYMNCLKEKLNIFDDALAQEIIEDYEAHFCQSLAKGKSEDEVSKELGDIDEIVAELELLYDAMPKKNKDHAKKSSDTKYENEDFKDNEQKSNSGFFDNINFDKVKFDNFSFDESNIKDITDKAVTLANQAVNFAGEFVNQNFQSDIHPDHETGNSDNQFFTNKTGSTNVPVKKLILESDCANVNINQSSGGSFSLNYKNEGSMKQKMIYRFYGSQKGDTFYGRVFKENGMGKFFNFSSQPYIAIDVFIPKNMDLIEIKGVCGDIEGFSISADDIKISTASGDVNIRHATLKNIDITSLSGDIQADSINGGYLSLVNKSGDVTIHNGLFNKSIVKSLSGDINMKNIKCLDSFADTASGDIEASSFSAEDVKLSTKSGDIHLSGGTFESLTLKSISGDVSAKDIIAERIDAGSISGDIELRTKSNRIYSKSTSGCINIVSESSFHGDINTISGEVDVILKGDSKGYKASVSTVSGSIDLRLKSENQRLVTVSGTYVLGNGESDIKIKTMSGDICITD